MKKLFSFNILFLWVNAYSQYNDRSSSLWTSTEIEDGTYEAVVDYQTHQQITVKDILTVVVDGDK